MIDEIDPVVNCHYNQTAAPIADTLSQNFETLFDAYDSQAADDFTVPVACRAKRIWVNGDYFGGPPPPCVPGGSCAKSVNLIFYNDALKGTPPDQWHAPGTVVLACPNQPYKDPKPPTTPAGPPAPNLGNFKVNFKASGCTASGLTFTAGTVYWVSVQANLDFNPHGEWGWGVRPLVAGTYKAQWQNPNGGFGTCNSWFDMDVCYGAPGEDVGFRLYWNNP